MFTLIMKLVGVRGLRVISGLNTHSWRTPWLRNELRKLEGWCLILLTVFIIRLE